MKNLHGLINLLHHKSVQSISILVWDMSHNLWGWGERCFVWQYCINSVNRFRTGWSN